MNKLALLACIIVLPVSTAWSQGASKSDLAKCSVMSNEVMRLECFDTLAETLGAAKPEVSSIQSTEDWTMRKEVSPLDDSTNFYLTVDSRNRISNSFGGMVTPSLTIRCKENRTALSVWWGVYLGLDSTYVTHRIDKEKAKTTKWALSTKNEHIGMWGGNASIPFVKRLFNKSELLLQVTPYGENSVLATFNVAGLATAIKPLRKQCNW